jgi:hypothetical protein
MSENDPLSPPASNGRGTRRRAKAAKPLGDGLVQSSPLSFSLKLLFSPPNDESDPVTAPHTKTTKSYRAGRVKEFEKEIEEYPHDTKTSTRRAKLRKKLKNLTFKAKKRDKKDPQRHQIEPKLNDTNPKTGRNTNSKASSLKSKVKRPPGRCFKCRKATSEANCINCSKCELGWHLDCLDYPLVFRPSYWHCPLHVSAHVKHIAPSSHFRMEAVNTKIEYRRECSNENEPQLNTMKSLLERIKLKDQNLAAPQPVGIRIPNQISEHYARVLGQPLVNEFVIKK